MHTEAGVGLSMLESFELSEVVGATVAWRLRCLDTFAGAVVESGLRLNFTAG